MFLGDNLGGLLRAVSFAEGRRRGVEHEAGLHRRLVEALRRVFYEKFLPRRLLVELHRTEREIRS